MSCLVPRHDPQPVGDHRRKAIHQALAFGGLAAQQRDLLGVLAHANEVEAEIGLVALLIEIERGQRPADQMREQRSGDRVDQRRPDQVARNRPPVERQRRRFRKPPEDHDEGGERHHGIEQAEADRQDADAVRSAVDELPHVLGDALVRVVGGVAGKLHAVVIAVAEPVAEIARRHPAPPADLEPLVEIELVDREHDVAGGQHAEDQKLRDEGVPVAVLQRVVEARVPLVDQDVDRDDAELDRDDGGEQDASRHAVLGGAEIRNGEPPDGGERRAKAGHGKLSCRGIAGQTQRFVSTIRGQRRPVASFCPSPAVSLFRGIRKNRPKRCGTAASGGL